MPCVIHLLSLSFAGSYTQTMCIGLRDSGQSIDYDAVVLTTDRAQHSRPEVSFPGDVPVVEGVVRLTLPAGLDGNGTDSASTCVAQLNKTCFGLCMQTLRVDQLGPLQNLTSLAVNPVSPRVPRPSATPNPCDCPRGLGVYLAANRSARWTFPGAMPPRSFNVSMSSDGTLLVRHAQTLGERRTCTYTFQVASGVVMGLEAGDGTKKPKKRSSFPVWATILIAVAGVFSLSALAFAVLRRLQQPAPSSSSKERQHRYRSKQRQGGKEERKKVRINGTGAADSPSAPLLEVVEEGQDE